MLQRSLRRASCWAMTRIYQNPAALQAAETPSQLRGRFSFGLVSTPSTLVSTPVDTSFTLKINGLSKCRHRRRQKSCIYSIHTISVDADTVDT